MFEGWPFVQPLFSLRNPPEWYTLQSILLLGERALACANYGQPSTTPMPYFTDDLDITCILIKIMCLIQLDLG